ncbi:MAG TPA: hypothetical protein VE954_09000 [Oligoflexus sp.]|uniref:hypothetical protein n=1 Tax=Oligoflexus sp. TaxID=1971216 RepID=UPI002D429C4C|nr:hypothetical protein [Oligoflexus sp.]HYX33238.1 hypothetical protein [Oligoflexus sp.]
MWPGLAEGGTPATKMVQFDMVYRKDSDLGVKLIKTFTEVFHQGGYVVKVDQMPLVRGLRELKNGRVDGTISRIGDIASLHGINGYIRLDVPLLYHTLSLYCIKDSTAMQNLKNPRVAYLQSSPIATRLAKMIADKSVQVSAVHSYRNMLVMMHRDRMDCMMSSDLHMDTERLGPKELQGVFRHDLLTLPGYSWIAKKHEAWKPFLEKELRQLVADKEWKKIYLDEKPRCGDTIEYLCPDGRIFVRQVKIQDALQSPSEG